VSIVIRTKRSIPSPIVEKAVEARPTSYRPRHAEAPDAGFRSGEASETTFGRYREAPDSGEGRVSYLETHFTHGRSRS
jgi:hypothetical protein